MWLRGSTSLFVRITLLVRNYLTPLGTAQLPTSVDLVLGPQGRMAGGLGRVSCPWPGDVPSCALLSWTNTAPTDEPARILPSQTRTRFPVSFPVIHPSVSALLTEGEAGTARHKILSQLRRHVLARSQKRLSRSLHGTLVSMSFLLLI